MLHAPVTIRRIDVATVSGDKLARHHFNRAGGYAVPMTTRPLYIAAYDVSDDERLRDALRVLRNYATGGQKSVFECFLSEAEKRSLLADIAVVLDPEQDRFFLIRLDPRMRVRTLGTAVPPADPSYFYVG